jgi:polyribonucleotide nucleotidyltransferase
MFDTKTVEIELGGKTLKLETGRVARQADGAVLATLGETVVLSAVTAATKNSRPPGVSRAASSSASAAPPKRKR